MELEASAAGAMVGCTGLAGFFVGSLYLAPKAVRELAHHDEVQILWRLRSTLAVVLLSPPALLLWARPEPGASVIARGAALLDLVGVRATGAVAASVLPLTAMVVLFAGPLVDLALRFRRSRVGSESLMVAMFPNCPAALPERFRNLVAAPFAEELVFRCCMGPLLLAGGLSHGAVVAVAPLFFGVAHLHHCYGMIKQGMEPKRAVLISAVQMTYTSLFGALEMHIFLRTRHFMSVFLPHSWCNLMGLPMPQFLQAGDENYEHRWLIGASYLVGVVGFVSIFNWCTDPAQFYF